MSRSFRCVFSGVLTLVAVFAGIASGTAPARAAEPILIGEINSYTRLPAFTEPYRKGWMLAVEEINANGGVNGRPLEVISRDDAGKPGTAVKIAEELVRANDVVMLTGTFFSNVGLAVADFARQNGILFIAAEPLTDALTGEKGNRYTFRLRPSTGMQAAMLAEQAAQTGATRWATVAPNYTYGQDAVAAFKAELRKRNPNVEFVAEQWPALFKIDAGATLRAIDRAEPDAIFNVTFGPDLAEFVREGSLRGVFENRAVVSLLTGEPEYLGPLGAETPEGWIVTGYPAEQIDTPAHTRFRSAYEARFGELPKLGSVVGYSTFVTVAAALRKAESTETEDLIAAMKGLKIDTPFGPVLWRASDHQATMGAYVGRTTVIDGEGRMTDWFYADGANYLPNNGG